MLSVIAFPRWISRTCVALTILSSVPSLAQNVNDGFTPAPNGDVRAIAKQADGKILIGGAFSQIGTQTHTLLARLNADGSTDSTFAVTIAGSEVQTIAVQTDGKILIGGLINQVGITPVTEMARLNTDGSIDLSFAPTVRLIVSELLVQRDGKILVNGISLSSSAAVIRLNADGSLDTSFTPPAFPSFEGPVINIRQMQLQTDGSLLLCGDIVFDRGFNHFGVVRLKPNGMLDSTFNMTRQVYQVNACAIRNDGEIVIGGDLMLDFPSNVAALFADGSSDGSFFSIKISDEVDSILLDHAGKILVAGAFTTANSMSRHGIAKFDRDGTLQAFNPTVLNAGANPKIYSMIELSDNDYVIGGEFTTVGSVAQPNVARLDGGGALDSTLNLAVDGLVYSTSIDAQGNITVGGFFGHVGGAPRNSLARFTSAGVVDANYNPNVIGGVEVIAQMPNGGSLIGGSFTTVGAVAQANLAYLNSNGTRNPAFAPSLNGEVDDIAVQPSGKILVRGSFTKINGASHAGFARLNSDGSLDTSFNVVVGPGLLAMATQSDGKILLGGKFSTIGATSVSTLVRLNEDGSLDSSFIPDTGSATVSAITVESSGSLLLISDFFSTGTGKNCDGLSRLDADGVITGCNFEVDELVKNIIELSDGKILIQGFFSTLDEPEYHGIARLNNDLSVDQTFADLGADGILTLSVAEDGKVVLGGDFTQIGGLGRTNLARISVPEAAQQSLAISNGRVTWLRSGSSQIPALPPTLLYSTDFTTYAPIGPMSQVPGGWQYNGLNPVTDHQFALRVQAPALSGNEQGSGSSQLMEEGSFFLSSELFKDGFDN